MSLQLCRLVQRGAGIGRKDNSREYVKVSARHGRLWLLVESQGMFRMRTRPVQNPRTAGYFHDKLRLRDDELSVGDFIPFHGC
jgi:hypothetical protein